MSRVNKMALEKIIREEKGLVVLIFQKEDCDFTNDIKDNIKKWIEKYQRARFAGVFVEDHPKLFHERKIKGSPTFVFLLGGNEVKRVEGNDVEEIEAAIIETLPSEFVGASRSIGDTAGSEQLQEEFFSKLLTKAHNTPKPTPPESPKRPANSSPYPEIHQHQKFIAPVFYDDLLVLGYKDSQIKEACLHAGPGASYAEVEKLCQLIEEGKPLPETKYSAPSSPEKVETKVEKPEFTEEQLSLIAELQDLDFSENLAKRAIKNNPDGDIDVLMTWICDYQDKLEAAVEPILSIGDWVAEAVEILIDEIGLENAVSEIADGRVNSIESAKQSAKRHMDERIRKQKLIETINMRRSQKLGKNIITSHVTNNDGLSKEEREREEFEARHRERMALKEREEYAAKLRERALIANKIKAQRALQNGTATSEHIETVQQKSTAPKPVRNIKAQIVVDSKPYNFTMEPTDTLGQLRDKVVAEANIDYDFVFNDPMTGKQIPHNWDVTFMDAKLSRMIRFILAKIEE